MTNEVAQAVKEAVKAEAVLSHEKVLRLECLKLATGTRIADDGADDILRDAEAFSRYVIGGAQ